MQFSVYGFLKNKKVYDRCFTTEPLDATECQNGFDILNLFQLSKVQISTSLNVMHELVILCILTFFSIFDQHVFNDQNVTSQRSIEFLGTIT